MLATVGDFMAEMTGILVDMGKIMSFDLFGCCPPLLKSFKHDDLNSSKVNSGNAAADVSGVSLEMEKIRFIEQLQRSPAKHTALTLHLVAPNSIVPV